MDSKTAFESQDLPAPASYAAESTEHKGCKRGRRFIKFVGLAALLLWAGHKYGNATPCSLRWQLEPADLEWPIPSDVAEDHCAEWSDSDSDAAIVDADYPYSADASLELPVSSEMLFLLSSSRTPNRHGIFSAGAVTFVQSDEVSDTIKVDIAVSFQHRKHLDATKACVLKRESESGDENGVGVGIFTEWRGKPHHRHHRPEVRFTVTVTFPGTDDGSALEINNFLTDLEIYAQTFENTEDIRFKTLSLKSSLAPITANYLAVEDASIEASLGSIHIQSLVAERADIATSLGSIQGTYNATDSLTITTSNAPINVSVNLFNEHEDVAHLRLTTSNGHLSSNISLFSSKDSGDAAFNITATTALAPLAVSIPTAPLDSTITLRATTALGSAHVKVPTTFEGALSGTTVLSSAKVIAHLSPEDPKGEDRERIVRTDQVRSSMVKGQVGWSEDGLWRGTVDVRTSMAPVTLEF